MALPLKASQAPRATLSPEVQSVTCWKHKDDTCLEKFATADYRAMSMASLPVL